MDQGAKDVTITPAITKKGRPTNIITVICDSVSLNSILNLLVSETGTLGVRIRSSERFVVPRTIVSIPIQLNEKNYNVRCKIMREKNTVKSFKVESDDIKLIADSINQPFKKAEELIRIAVKEKLELK
jgi:hypothetical protein